jgi:hypothetical protein
MARQLHLRLHDNTDGPRDWRIDESTRQLGFQGVANARAVLRAARLAAHAPAETEEIRRSAA